MRAFQRTRPQCFNPRFQCQLGYVTPGHAFVLAVCIFMLPMAVVADEHAQLTTTEPVILFGRWCVHPRHIFKHTSLILPSLNNILPAMALQNVEVKSNIWCLSRSLSHTRVCHVSSSPGLSICSGLGRMVVGAVVVLLLLMSGDIETNPGPVGNKLITDDLGCVLEEVLDVSAQWYHLGLQLKVKTGTLDSIRTQFSCPRDQLLEMLKTWLTTGNDPSWQTLTDALRKDSVGASQLARSLEAKHFNVERPEGDRGTSPPSFSSRIAEKPAPLKIPLIPQADNETTHPYSLTAPHTETQKANWHSSSSSSISSPASPFGCGCGKCTFFSFIEKGCPTPLSSIGLFPYLDVSGLTNEQQQGLKQRLCCESHEIMIQFQKLVRATVKSLTKQQIPLSELRSLVMTLGAFDPVYKKSQVSAFYHCFKDLEKANEVSDIFWILKDYFSFFNYHIIEHIITELGTEEDNQNLQTYKEQFDQYAKRRIYECLPWFGPISETGHVDVFVKVDSEYDNFSVKEVENFCWKLCRIYGITSHSVFRLCQVEKGCLQFMFQIPSFMQQELFPLSSEQETALAEEGVIKLTCGDYQFIKELKDSPTESSDGALQNTTHMHLALIREDLPGVPLYPVPVHDMKDLLRHGDHLIYQVCGKPYRPCYKSALVLRAENTKIQVIMNSSEGIITEWLDYSDNFYMVKYSHCHYTNEKAVERAKRRLKWGEKCYHCLYNNSHHFVTWAKTGKEHSLADIIASLTCQKVNHLTPVLTKVPISDLRDVKEGDHIMTGAQHYLVASIDTAHNTYTGYTYIHWCKKVVKETHTLSPWSTYRIDYEESFTSREAITNAEKEFEQSEWSDRDKSDCDNFGSDKFVTKMKTGKKYSFNEQCLFANENEFSCTRIVPGIAVDEGDHLMVKDDNENYQSVLVLKHASQSAFIITPDLNSEIQERCCILVIEEDTEVYRINYRQSLPVVEVFQRAMSDKGVEVLRECKNETSKFVSWAKTGRKEIIDVIQLKSQIAQMCPFQREKILSVDEIQVGDHLIRAYRTYWWHFMVTEIYLGSFKFKTIYCNNHWISETVETINPSKDDVYRIIYPESLPVATTIERARSRLGHHFSPLGRMWFVRWAKTGSDDGIEVDFLLNNAMPASKSRVHTFAQLNPGDYLVEKENLRTTSHHYLVTEVTSHSRCSVIESWWTVKERDITFNENSTYYRLNYSDGACISTEQVIANAQKLLGKRIIIETQYKCHILVNYLKTGNAIRITIGSLQDDRTLLRRERVSSALELRPGDHIERSMFSSGAEYHHMIVIEQPTHDKKCKVIHFKSAVSKADFIEEEVDIYEKGDNVFRIKYPERYTPDHTIEHLRMKCLEAYSKQPNPEDFDEYEYKKNTCEQLIMEATVGECLSIQVTEHQRRALVHTTSAVVYTGRSLQKISTVTARRAATKAVKAGVKAIAKSGAKAATKPGVKVTPKASSAALSAEALFQQGFRSAVSGTAVGVATSVAAATNVAFEGPLLAKSVYKLHLKKTFDQISSGEFKRGIVQESIKSANTVIGAVGGAVLGQITIPVPVLGAAVGGAVGGLAGQAFGRAEGWAVGKLVRDPRPVTLPRLIETSFVDNPPPMDRVQDILGYNCDNQSYTTGKGRSKGDAQPLPSPKPSQLGVQFIDPIEIISCDFLGCDYNNPRHDVKLRIPKGAIQRSEGTIDIEFGVAMYGPFRLSDGRSVKRVSPVVWLCVQQDGFSGFQKDVEIMIPHFCHFSAEDAYTYLKFLKADHEKEFSENEYLLKAADGRAVFDCATHGTLLTRHLCLMCIATSAPLPNEHTKYYLIGEKNLKAQECQIVFFICYFLKSCIQTVQKQLDKDSKEIYPTEFMFADGKDVIELKIKPHNEAPGWLIAMESSKKISAKQVDFQSMCREDLQLREDTKLYPPRFVVKVKASNTAEDFRADFKFEGATEDITKEIIFTNGTTPCCDKQEEVHLADKPKLQHLQLLRYPGGQVRVMDVISGHWSFTAIALGFDEYSIDKIKSSSQNQAREACRMMMMEWLKGARRTPVTWETLVHALRDAELADSAEQLLNILK